MVCPGLTMLISRPSFFNIPFRRILCLRDLFSLSCEPIPACSHRPETVLAVRKSLFRVSVKPLSCPRRGFTVCPKRLFRNAGKALWGRWEGERVGRWGCIWLCVSGLSCCVVFGVFPRFRVSLYAKSVFTCAGMLNCGVPAMPVCDYSQSVPCRVIVPATSSTSVVCLRADEKIVCHCD